MRSSASVIQFVCLFVRTITQKTNDPKVFKLGVGNDLGIAYSWYNLGSKGQSHGHRVTSAKHIEGVSYALY